MPATPSNKDTQEAILAELVTVNVNLTALIAGQGADTANIALIATGMPINEALLRNTYAEQSLNYKGSYGTTVEITDIDAAVALVPTQI